MRGNIRFPEMKGELLRNFTSTFTQIHIDQYPLLVLSALPNYPDAVYVAPDNEPNSAPLWGEGWWIFFARKSGLGTRDMPRPSKDSLPLRETQDVLRTFTNSEEWPIR
jgi:hypothetical protein